MDFEFNLTPPRSVIDGRPHNQQVGCGLVIAERTVPYGTLVLVSVSVFVPLPTACWSSQRKNKAN